MVALLSAGPIIERLFGSAAFAALYLAAGITGSLASLAVHPLVASAGASGAIFGVYGALGAVMLIHRQTIPPVALKRLGGVAASFIFYNLVYAVGRAGIDNMAHLGGLVGGALAGGMLFRELVPGRAPALRRPLLIAAGALALAAIVSRVLPAPVPFAQIVSDYLADEKVALASYNDLLQRMKAGKVDSREAANTLQYGILPGWKRTEAQLKARAQKWSGDYPSASVPKQLLSALRELAAVRGTYWWRMVTALLQRDTKTFVALTVESNQRGHEVIAKIDDLERKAQAGGSR
jgi:rhomboid protease GluP